VTSLSLRGADKSDGGALFLPLGTEKRGHPLPPRSKPHEQLGNKLDHLRTALTMEQVEYLREQSE